MQGKISLSLPRCGNLALMYRADVEMQCEQLLIEAYMSWFYIMIHHRETYGYEM